MHNIIIYNEDRKRVRTVHHQNEAIAYHEAMKWLLNETADRRLNIRSELNDAEWLDMLLNNGFYQIEHRHYA